MSAAGERRVTGRQVLVWILAFFGVVTLVNAVMIWFALTSHPEVIRRTAMETVQERISWPS